jgi:hypothetical protein
MFMFIIRLCNVLCFDMCLALAAWYIMRKHVSSVGALAVQR